LKYRTCLFLLCILLAPALKAQVAQDSQKPADSALRKIQALLSESEALRVRDSIRAAVLHDELSRLKGPSTSRQKELQAELDQVRNQDSLRMLQQQQAIEELRSKSGGMAVTLFYDTLFHIYAPLGAFSAAQRAANASERIKKLYEAPDFDPDSLVVRPQYGLLNICYGETVISSVSDIDALWAGGRADSLAGQQLRTIRQRIRHFREAYSFDNILVRIGYVAIVLAALLAVLWLIRFLFRRLNRWITARKARISKGIKVRNYQLFSPEYVLAALRQALRIFRLLLMALSAYLALTVTFSIFPATRTWTRTLLGWIWQPLRSIATAFIHYLPNLITIAVIIIVTRFVTRIFRFFSLEIERGILNIRGFHKEWARPTYNIVRFLLYAFAFVVIFPYLPGSDSEAFKGVSVFLGILFSIGSSSAVSNTVAGLVITYMRPFKAGDWISVNDVTGYVIEKTVLVTRLRTIHNEDITVPNSMILAGHTVNYSSSGEAGLILHATVTIGYDVPWERVHALLIEAANATEDIDSTKEPFVFQKALDDFYVSYELNAYTFKPERMYHTRSALHQNIQHFFRQAGVEIMSPQQIHIKP